MNACAWAVLVGAALATGMAAPAMAQQSQQGQTGHQPGVTSGPAATGKSVAPNDPSHSLGAPRPGTPGTESGTTTDRGKSDSSTGGLGGVPGSLSGQSGKAPP